MYFYCDNFERCIIPALMFPLVQKCSLQPKKDPKLNIVGAIAMPHVENNLQLETVQIRIFTVKQMNDVHLTA